MQQPEDMDPETLDALRAGIDAAFRGSSSMMRDGDTPLIDAARYGRAADVATVQASGIVAKKSVEL